MGRLTIRVFDTATGTSDQNLVIALFRIVDDQRQSIKSVRTNHGDRCDAPLSEDDTLRAGVYELDFSVGGYYRAAGVELPELMFLDMTTLRSGMVDTSAHCHVSLPVLPWSYSTYRSS